VDYEPEKKSRNKPNWKPRDQWRKYERRGNGALLVEEELATALGEETRTIRTWRHEGLIPAIVLGHRSIRYRLDAVLTALRKREVGGKSQ
jgi:Helix-turn-helix domain